MKHAPKGQLTPKQARFVSEYLVDLNGKQAAIRTGYSPKTAEVQASQLLSLPKVKAAVAAGKALQLERADLSASRVLEELRRLAFADVRNLFDEHGKLKPLHDLTPEQSASIASLEVVIKNAEAGDGHTDTVHKIKVWDKPRVLEMLAKHFKLLDRALENTDGDLIAKLLAGRKRAADAKAS